MSKVVIVAADHFLQNLESTCVTAEGKEWESKQKELLKDQLEALLAKHKVQFVGEEARLDRDCLGKQLADAHGCDYSNLTMPWEERKKRGIEEDYDTSAATREQAYRAFERFMFETIQRCRDGANSILVICGSHHMRNVAPLLESVGDEVFIEDTTQSDWYRGRPIESASGVKGFDRD